MCKTVKCPACWGSGLFGICRACDGTGRLSRTEFVEAIARGEKAAEDPEMAGKEAAKLAETVRKMKQSLADADAHSARTAPKHQYRLTCPRCRREITKTRKPRPMCCSKCFKSFEEGEAAGQLFAVERVELVAV